MKVWPRDKLERLVLRNGRVYYDAPYFIFIKDISEEGLFDFMKKRGIINIEKLDTFNPRRNQYEFLLIENESWKLIMDNWWYSLFHLNCKTPLFNDLGTQYEVFQCVVGDSDHSFSFQYYKDGELKRFLSVSNPSYRKNDLKIEIDTGSPLRGESKYLNAEGEYEKVINVLYEQGIKFPSNIDSGNSYKYNIDWKGISNNV